MEMKKNKYGIKVGDVFKSTHGYSMIINDFYKVIDIIGTTKIAVSALNKIKVSDDGYGQQGIEKMDYNNFDFREKPMAKMVQCKGHTPFIKISDYEYAYLLNEDEYDREYWFDYMD